MILITLGATLKMLAKIKNKDTQTLTKQIQKSSAKNYHLSKELKQHLKKGA